MAADNGPDRCGINRGPVEFFLTVLRGVRWWVTSVMGDNAYDRYVRHLAIHHPAEAPPTEREYWRNRYAEADLNPGARCC